MTYEHHKNEEVFELMRIGREGTPFRGIKTGQVAINPPNIATADTGAAVAVTIAGAKVGDVFVLIPPAALEDDLFIKGARVTADDTLTVYFYATAIVDGANLTWDYIWFDVNT